VLEKLVSAFGSLRELSDQGLISYPYSTRELVNIVKHLEKFPDDSLANVLANVYDFDYFSEQSDLKSTFKEVMNKHGIPIGSASFQVSLAPMIPLPSVFKTHDLKLTKLSTSNGVFSSVFDLKWEKQAKPEKIIEFKCDKQESRVELFTELRANWSLEEKQQIITDMIVNKNEQQNTDLVFVSGIKPMNVIQIDTQTNKAVEIGIGEYFSTAWRTYFPRLKLFPVNSNNASNEVLLYEETTNGLFKVDFKSGEVYKAGKELRQSASLFDGKILNSAKKAINKYFVDQNQTFKLVPLDEASGRFIGVKYHTGQLSIVDVPNGSEVGLSLENLEIGGFKGKLRINHCVYLGSNSVLVVGYDSGTITNSENLRPSNLAYFLIKIPADLTKLVNSASSNLNDLNEHVSVHQLDKSVFDSQNDYLLNQVQVKSSAPQVKNETNEAIYKVKFYYLHKTYLR
jgi:hypothetical protein